MSTEWNRKAPSLSSSDAEEILLLLLLLVVVVVVVLYLRFFEASEAQKTPKIVQLGTFVKYV